MRRTLNAFAACSLSFDVSAVTWRCVRSGIRPGNLNGERRAVRREDHQGRATRGTGDQAAALQIDTVHFDADREGRPVGSLEREPAVRPVVAALDAEQSLWRISIVSKGGDGIGQRVGHIRQIVARLHRVRDGLVADSEHPRVALVRRARELHGCAGVLRRKPAAALVHGIGQAGCHCRTGLCGRSVRLRLGRVPILHTIQDHRPYCTDCFRTGDVDFGRRPGLVTGCRDFRETCFSTADGCAPVGVTRCRETHREQRCPVAVYGEGLITVPRGGKPVQGVVLDQRCQGLRYRSKRIILLYGVGIRLAVDP